MNIEEEIELYNQRVYGGKMQSHNKQTLRTKLKREVAQDEWLGELSLRDYLPQDEGMHWSDNKKV